MVVGVAHDDSVCVADRDVVRVLQLAGLLSLGAEFSHKSAVALEHLDAVILLVANVNKPECISTNAPGVVKLPVCGSLTAECSQKMTTGVKYLDPVIVCMVLSGYCQCMYVTIWIL